MSDTSSKDRDGQLRLPKRTATAAEEMSVDTRVAAQAIINEDAIGVHSPPSESHPQSSRFIEWVLQYRILLTVGVLVLVIAIVSVSVFSEANERAHHVNLQKALQELTADFIESGGTEMQGWIDQNDDRSISQRFKNEKAALIQTLETKGFQIKPSNLKIRKDEKTGIILGAVYTVAQQDERLVWGSTDSEREKSRAGNSEPSQVLMDQWDSLIFIGLMSALFIAFIWLAPALLKRKKAARQTQS